MAGELQLPTLVQRFRIDGTGARTGVAQIEGQSRSLTGAVGGIKTAVHGAVGAFLAFEGVHVLKDVIGDAVKTQQALKTTTALFGDSGEGIAKWSEGTAQSLGLSKQATLGMAAGVGTMLKGFGLAAPAAADMSKELIKVAVDTAAFKNADPTAVLSGFQRGLTGAARGLKVYGIDTSTAAQSQAALSLHIEGTSKSWTAAQKAAVFYQLILKGTSQATGEFKARSGDLAIQQKILNAEWSNMKDNIGTGLLPVVTTLFSGLTAGFRAVGPEGEAFIGKIIGVGLAGTIAVVGVLGLAKALSAMQAAIVAVTAADEAEVIAAEAAKAEKVAEAESASVAAAALSAEAAAAVESALGSGTAAAAATLAAEGLTAEAEAAVAAAAASGGVDLAAYQAAVALTAKAEAARISAEAMVADAGATEIATVASRSFALTPVGAVALATGVAIAFLTAKTALFGHATHEANASVDDMIDRLLAEKKTANDVADSILVTYIKAHGELIPNTLGAAGISLNDYTNALANQGDSYVSVKKRLEEYALSQEHAADVAFRSGKIDQATWLDTGKAVRKNVGEATKFLEENRSAILKRTEAFHNSISATEVLAGKNETLAASEDRVRRADIDLTTAIINDADRLRALQEGRIGLAQTEINLQTGQAAVAEKQKQYDDLRAKGQQKTKEGIALLNELHLAQLQQQGDTLRGVDQTAAWADSQSHLSDTLKSQADAQKALDKARADAAVGKGSPGDLKIAEDNLAIATDAVGVAQDKQRAILIAFTNHVTGPLHDALVQYLIDTRAPKPIVTPVSTPGLDTATTRLHNFRNEIGKIPPKHDTTINVFTGQAQTDLFTLKEQIRSLGGLVTIPVAIRAEGGRVPGSPRAGGGPVAAGHRYRLGELGVEELTLYQGGGGIVTTHADLAHDAAATKNSDLSRSIVPVSGAPSASASADEKTNVTWDIDIYPAEHTLTERGLVDQLRFAERHGPLHAQTGVPREIR